ncbi:MAG: class I SAM-dependent methyltransferase [Acidimicrobiales bacterium]
MAEQARYDRMLAPFNAPLLGGVAPDVADHVLDVGCGNGATTREAARAVLSGAAVGIDLSGPMLAEARRRAAEDGLANVRFETGDAQVFPFEPSSFDAVISRFGVMFFADPAAAFANLARAVRPRGRMGFVCWQGLVQNEWMAVPAGAALQHVPLPDLGDPEAPGPFSLADPARIERVLSAAGWSAITIEPVAPRLWFGSDAIDFVEFAKGTGLARALLDNVDDTIAQRALDAMRDSLVPYETSDGLRLGSAAWLVTARRDAG